MTLHGIDVSNWQGDINWSEVRNANYRFAAIKATEGTNISDSTFYRNWSGAQKVGMIRLAYHFFRPEYDGYSQARHLHSTLRDNGRITNHDGIMLDLEAIDGTSDVMIIRRAEQFVMTCRKEIDKQVVLYTGPGYWQQLGQPNSAILKTCPLWVASWGSIVAPLLPNLAPPAFWQYASTGIVPGITSQVDLDLFLGNMHQLHAIINHHL